MTARSPRAIRALRAALLAALALPAAALLAPPGALAQGCPCPSLQALLKAAAEQVVRGIAPPLEIALRDSAAWGTGELHKDLAALREAVLFTGRGVEAAVRAADKSAAERQIERTYEAASQPPSSCGNDAMGAGYQLSERARGEAAADIAERALSRKGRYRRPLDYQGERLDPSWPAPARAAHLLGAVRSPATYTLAETAEAERLVETLSDPYPAPALSEAQRGTPAGRAYEAARLDHETRQALYQSALARRAADRAPSVEGLEPWARGKWEDMGGSGDPPGLAEGRLSQEALFWYLANMRLGSANWHEQTLAALPEAGLLRELASMEAVELELLRRLNERLELVAALLAADGLERLGGAPREALLALYNRAAGTGE
ncbi:MAG: hypothetical protein LBG06_11910 [Deltaproteobacteria bacterium]|jgi:hypothetical protein|nr:hypothetical protein [Deltaproteobacteria bacterium]